MTDLAHKCSLQAPPDLGRVTWVFVRYGNFTLGGGSATSAILHGALVEKRQWLTEDQFALCFALGRVTPGTNLLAFCTGCGWVLRGIGGAITSLLAASIPCSIFVTVLTALFSYWRDNNFAQEAIHGAIAAAVAITVKTCWTIAKPYFKGQGRLRVILVSAAAFFLYVVAGIPAIEVLLLAAVVGAFLPTAGS
jgi:chromate transporter